MKTWDESLSFIRGRLGYYCLDFAKLRHGASLGGEGLQLPTPKADDWWSSSNDRKNETDEASMRFLFNVVYGYDLEVNTP
jgi:hypothetical protein